MNKNVPNILTMARIACTPIIIILFLLPIPYGIGVFVALGVYIVGCLTDFVDGYIARKYGLVSDFGKFMDQIADKFITTTATILVLFAGVTNTWAAVLILLVIVLRDILISGIRMIAANKNVVIAADIYGKVKSFFLDIANMILMLYIGLRAVVNSNSVDFVRLLGLALLIVGAVLSLVSCVNYGLNATRALSPKNNKNVENEENLKENNNIDADKQTDKETKLEENSSKDAEKDTLAKNKKTAKKQEKENVKSKKQGVK